MFAGPIKIIKNATRYASRGVLIDERNYVAMMCMSELNLYKLPGGGIEEGERKEESFTREIKEETGYVAKIIYELGYIEEHKNRNDFMQVSYCYIAKVNGEPEAIQLSASEIESGMLMKWMTLENALEVMNNSLTRCTDYSTKFMMIRDKTILENAIEILKK